MAEFRNSDANNASVGKVNASSSDGGKDKSDDKKNDSDHKDEKKKDADPSEDKKDSKEDKKNSDGKEKSDKKDKKDNDGNDKKDGKQKLKDTVKNVRRAGTATNAAGKVAFLTKVMNFISMMLSMLVQGATTVAGGFFGFLASMFSMIGSFFSAAGAAIASFFGFMGSAAATAVSVLIATLTGGLVVGGAVLLVETTLYKDEALVDCREDVVATRIADEEVDAKMLYHAQKIYSVFHKYGLTDECIAGILGNWQAESEIDPTCIEGIYTEPYQVDLPRKKKALESLHIYTEQVLFPMYSGKVSICKECYRANDGLYYPGLGLGQWTGGGAKKFLDIAKSVDWNWWELDFQLAYALSGHYRPDFFPDWRDNPSETPEEAAEWFAHRWEGNTKLAQEKRKQLAGEWYGRMSSWEIQEEYANSVLDLARQLGMVADDMAAKRALDDCVQMYKYDNSDIARAATSYAYPRKILGYHNNGTPLYVRVHEAIFPGDPYFMSCDRGIACAIRWAGADDSYPAGATQEQYRYMMTSDRWESVGMANRLSVRDLSPGDVFAVNGHVFLYVSEEIIKEIHKTKIDKGSNSVSASSKERSPGCGIDSSDIIDRMNGQDWLNRGVYEVFRCVKPMNSPKYKNAGSTKN